MPEYLVVISAEKERGLTPAEEHHCLTEYGKWAEKLKEKHIIARRLDLAPGEMLPSKKSLITDGPFAEAKELIAGIIILEASNHDQAIQLANACPLREYFQLFVKQVRD